MSHLIVTTAQFSLKPDFTEAHYGLINVFVSHGKLDEVVNYYHNVLHLGIDDAEIYHRIGETLIAAGNAKQAVKYFQQAAQLAPAQPAPVIWLARILATGPDPNVHDPNAAIGFAKHAAELTNYKDPAVLEILAQSYAANKQFDLAAKTIEDAMSLLSAEPDSELAVRLREQLQQYQRQKP